MNAIITKPARRRARSRQHGFTLMEILVSVGFMSAMAGLISGSTFLSIRTSAETGAVADIAVETAKTTRWLVRDVHRAETTNIVDLASAVDTASFTWDDGGAVTCTFALNGTDMSRDCGTSQVNVGRYINNLLFSRNGNLVVVSYQIVPPGSPGKAQTIDLNIALGGG